MELWDAYDVRGNSLEHTLIRGEEVPAGEYHLVADILVRHTDGSFLLTQRDPQKPTFVATSRERWGVYLNTLKEAELK